MCWATDHELFSITSVDDFVASNKIHEKYDLNDMKEQNESFDGMTHEDTCKRLVASKLSSFNIEFQPIYGSSSTCNVVNNHIDLNFLEP